MFNKKKLWCYVTSGHGDHEEVDGIPVSEGLGTGELGKISRIFQLKEKFYSRLRSLQLMDRFSDQVNNSSTSKPDRDKESQKLSKPEKIL